MTYGKGRWVAVGTTAGNQPVMVSTDGQSWKEVNAPAKDWISVTYGGGKFVATANGSNVIMYSEDGYSWTTATVPNGSYPAVAYGDGRFIITTSQNAGLFYWADENNLTTWNPVSVPAANYDCADFGNGTFVALGANNSYPILASTDGGETWTQGNWCFGRLGWCCIRCWSICCCCSRWCHSSCLLI